MKDTNYTYAVARIRAIEPKMLTRSDMDLLSSMNSEEACLSFLRDKGFQGEDLLKNRLHDAWALVKEIAPDPQILFPLLLKYDYHNVKAAIKGVIASADCDLLFEREGTLDLDKLVKGAMDGKFDFLPTPLMRRTAEEAFELMLKTGNAQYVDMILDRAQLLDMAAYAAETGVAFLIRYIQFYIACIDINIAVRAKKMGRDREFLLRSAAPCSLFSMEEFADAALADTETFYAFLSEVPALSDGVQALADSLPRFEKWRDDQILGMLSQAKYSAFGPEPLFAYLLATEAEVSSLRILLSAKRNFLSEQVVSKRVRELYY